jgi:PadR family transcriptional regulator PadR
MENKGLVKTWMGDPTPRRGGRAKRMVRVTPRGLRAAAAFYGAVRQVTRNVAWESE